MNDYSLFSKTSGSSVVLIVVYVGDNILTGDELEEIAALKCFLHNQFKIKDLGLFNFFGALKLLILLKVKLKVDSGVPLPAFETYRSLVGKLNFLTHTRPDLCFVVEHLSQFLQRPTSTHMEAALHLLWYLKGISGLRVFFNNSSDVSIAAYCDSDWVACPDTRRSVTSFCVLLGGSLISWKAKKQPIISLSSTEPEYRAISKLVTELTWLVRLLDDFYSPFSTLIPIFCDYQATIHIAQNPIFHE